ncbi:MAG: threonine--tRNA ligase [Chloroflexi bacterium]|nr:threonine--tRNA ligase [Chloroflexota bacterium]MBM3174628.1 threonine--tRNA ligase [Chloroflexota bacterium]MBM4449382.1 threonine--tRNA ligase [Chloroflexota bacterium]
MSVAEQEARQEKMRHSAAHIMAEAVQSLFPEAKFGIGPAIEDGFYYDFELPRALVPDDLPRIEARMKEIVASGLPFVREELDKPKALKLFSSQPYKAELIQELADDKVSIYRQGSFVDLCRGPHVDSTDEVKAFKLTSIAGAYWRGDEKRPMLQRVYGVAFDTETELESYLARLEEAVKRDHRKLGKELDLFSLHEEAGPGLVHWHPKGGTVRQLIEDFWREEHRKRGYDIVFTPHISKVDLWKASGHWDFYRDSMYSPMQIDEVEYVVKPMNCIGHILMYKTQLRSYRNLPMRFAELGTVYRYERSGVLHGLARVRGFTQDDAHIFCRPDQIVYEVTQAVKLSRFMLRTFGFDEYQIMLSTRPEKYAGTLEVWEMATVALRKVLEDLHVDYEIDPGEGVFYGPKIDVKLKDALGRLWQGPTIQVDFNLPQRFDVNYIGDDGAEHQVVMVHRTVLGSMERFMACLVEHYAGAFPVWLSPVQVVVIPIADRHLDYVNQVANQLRESGMRVQVDERSERMNLKIREAQLNKIPYMLVIGDKEMSSSSVSLRLRNGEDMGALSVAEFISRAKSVIETKATDKL